MKARDIIPGWPRGKSTSPGPDLYVSPFWTRIWVHCCPSPYDLAMLEDQLDSDRRYHEAQQRMVDQWHRGIVIDASGSLWPRVDGGKTKISYRTYMLGEDPVSKIWIRPEIGTRLRLDFDILWRTRSTARRSEGDV